MVSAVCTTGQNGGMARRKISSHAGVAALQAVIRSHDAGEVPERATLATAVRYLLEELAEAHPGNTLEVRVPPFGAVQCVAGPKHTRGTPPNVIECDAETWIALATGRLAWGEAVSAQRVAASGTRAWLTDMVPLITQDALCNE